MAKTDSRQGAWQPVGVMEPEDVDKGAAVALQEPAQPGSVLPGKELWQRTCSHRLDGLAAKSLGFRV